MRYVDFILRSVLLAARWLHLKVFGWAPRFGWEDKEATP
jgi:hypothetical protein